jgi:hypothetical protein
MSSPSNASTRSKLVVLLILAVSSSAWARRVAITKFTGQADAAQKLVQDIVQRDHTVVSDAAVKKAQRKLKIAQLTQDTVALLAAELQVDAVVAGSVQKTGVTWGLTLVLLDGKTGAVADTVSVPLRAPKLDAAAKREVEDWLVPALAKVGAPPEPPAAAAPAAADVEPAPLAPTPEPAPPPPDVSDLDRTTRSAAADVEIGLSGVVRTLSFNSAADLMTKPNGYKGSLVPSLLVAGEIYPFAFGDPAGVASGFGVAFILDKVLTIKSKLTATSTEYDTSQLRWGAGLVWRYNIGAGATGPTLKLGAGYGRLDFSIDHGTADIGLPDVSYSYVHVGGGGRLPLGVPWLALALDLRYLHMLSAGQMTQPDQYGGGSSSGFTGDAAIELTFARHGIVRAGGRYQRIALTFDGTGAMTHDAMGQSVGGALDEYWSGYLTGGYLF